MSRNNQLMRVELRSIVILLCVVASPDARAQAATSPPAPAIALPQAIMQANGDFITMPQNLPASRRTGLNLFVDTHWANGYGYRPVEITVSSPQPTTSAHKVTVALHFGSHSVVTSEQKFELPLGAKRASTTISVPFYDQTDYRLRWDVWVDGVKDVDLSVGLNDAPQRLTASTVSAAAVKVLVPGPQAKQKSAVSTTASDIEVFTLTLASFPHRWLDYTCLDAISLSIADLEELEKQHPAALEAIARWVRTGGQLWVSDAGAELEKLSAVSKLLKVPGELVQDAVSPVERDTNDAAAEKSNARAASVGRPTEVGWRSGRFRGWRQGQAQGFSDARTGRTRWAIDPREIAALERDPNLVRTRETAPEDPMVERRWPSESGEWYVEQRFGLGTLRAFRGPNEAALFAHSSPTANPNTSLNPDIGQLPRALSLAVRSTRHWDTRHGIIPDAASSDFAKLLVPGVGLAPVTEFQVLITLFVLLIGPFNYWILQRYKRLQLLVLTVPLSAAVATLALFGYAIVSDGFATKVRVRSYTTIDQTKNEAACWARISYYAGVAPSKGLAMSADLVMYPILPNWGSDDSGATRDILWNDDSALLTRGWLMSRTPTQYLMVRSRTTPHRIDVTSGNGKMQIVNRLGTRIESLLVLDEDGNFFSGSALEDESRVALQPISREDAAKQIGDLIRENEPEMPAELTGSDRDFFGRRGRTTRRVFGRYRSPPGGGQIGENLANRALSDLAGLNGRPALELPVRSYVAIAENGPEVETGISHADEDGSFHVVVGRW